MQLSDKELISRIPTFLGVRLLCLYRVPLSSSWALRLIGGRTPMMRPVLGRGHPQTLRLQAGQDVMGFVLRGLRGTPVHRPELSGAGLRGDWHLHFAQLLPLSVICVTGGSAKNYSDQQEAPKGKESNVGRDGARGKERQSNEKTEGGIEKERLEIGKNTLLRGVNRAQMERDIKQKLMQPNGLQETNWSDLRAQCNQNSLFAAYHRSIASACSLAPRCSDHL